MRFRRAVHTGSDLCHAHYLRGATLVLVWNFGGGCGAEALSAAAVPMREVGET